MVSGVLLGLALKSTTLEPWIAGAAWGPAGLALAAWSWSRASDGRDAFLRSWIAFGLAHLVAFPWVIRHPETGPAAAGALAIVLVPMLVSAAWSLLWSATAVAGPILRALVLASGTAVLEFALHAGPVPLPWGLPGDALASWTPADGAAAVIGSAPVAALVIAAAALLAGIAGAPVARSRIATIAMLAAILLLPVFGIPPVSLIEGRAPATSAPLKAGLVQPGLDPLAWDRHPDRLELLVGLTDSLMAAAEAPRWVQWPETALRDSADVRLAQRAASRWATPVVTGALVPNGDGTVSNALLVLEPDGRVHRYDKRRLVPFVEFVPFGSQLARLFPGVAPQGSYRPGDASSSAEIDSVRVSLAVCFETLFPSSAIEAAANGSRLILAVTNDAWWRDPRAAATHLAFSRRRALESGVPLVQASVSGFTGVVNPDGTVYEAVPWMERRAVVVEIPETSPAREWPWTGVIFASILGVGLVAARNRGRRVVVDATP